MSAKTGTTTETISEENPSGVRDFLHAIKTNRFGVAKVSRSTTVDGRRRRLFRNVGYQLIFDVHDKTGATVSYDEMFWRRTPIRRCKSPLTNLCIQAKDQITVSVRAPSISPAMLLSTFLRMAPCYGRA